MEEYKEKLEEQLNKEIKNIVENESVQIGNIDYLYKLVDIHKDMKNEEYWKKKEEDIMNYRNYEGYGNDSMGGYGDSYGRRGVAGTGRGRYRDGGDSYGRRGVAGTGRGRYRGEEMLDEMKYHYGNYQDSNSYGAKEDSAYKMTEAFKEFGFSIANELEPNEKKMFKQAMQEIMQELDV